MMSYSKNRRRVPKLIHHKASGQGVVRLSGKDVYCGPFGTTECQVRYHRAIAEWEAADRLLVQAPATTPAVVTSDMTVNEVAEAYLEYADSYYVKNDEPTTEVRDIRLSIKPLRELFGHVVAAEFTPRHLKSVRQAFLDADLCRNEVKKRTRRIVRLFGWGVEEGLVPAAVHWALKAVKGMRRGQAGVRESKPVKPVPDEVVDATLLYLSAPVRAMVQLQRPTGMRPQEVCRMRTIDVDMSGSTWLYTPERHKREHHGKPRVIPIGPQAQAILKPWFRSNLAAYLFSPREAMELRRAEMRRKRKTPLQPSQRSWRKAKPKVAPGDRYEVSSYDHAIAYAIRQANKAAKQGKKPEIPHLHPNQLRHAVGTLRRQPADTSILTAPADPAIVRPDCPVTFMSRTWSQQIGTNRGPDGHGARELRTARAGASSGRGTER